MAAMRTFIFCLSLVGAISPALGAEIAPEEVVISFLRASQPVFGNGSDIYFTVQNNSVRALEVGIFKCNVFDKYGAFVEILQPTIINVASGKLEYTESQSKVPIAALGKVECRIVTLQPRS